MHDPVYDPPSDASLNVGQVGLGMQGIGGILSVIGAFGSAWGQRQQLKTQAAIDQINATTAERSAQAALLAGQHEEQNSMLRTAQLKGTQTAGLAAHGVDIGEGSAARVLATTDLMGEVDKNTIAANALRAAWGYRTQATNARIDAGMKDSQAGAISPFMAGGTSLLNSAGSVASNWYALNKTGGSSGYYLGRS